jgi:cytochrome oxidase Cu insertion factor (SCO1/SenC/PrrC family)
MRPPTRLLPAVAWSAAAATAALLAGQFLLTPIQGHVVVLASAQRADQMAGSSVELHSSSGWTLLGRFSDGPVPAAPKTVILFEAKALVGSYDRLRLGSHELPARVSVQQNVLASVLIGVIDGRPAMENVYIGNAAVSLGLNELSGQLKPMPSFQLVDQFGRSFNNSSIAGRDVVVAAFHTTCRQTCPLYTGLFLQLQRQIPPTVLLIEATNNPWEDTPDVLRAYAGRIGASWTFVTGDPSALKAFWKPFGVELSRGDSHRSTLAVIDSHGYIRSYFLGAPDLGGSLPGVLVEQLDSHGQGLFNGSGASWGPVQVLDTLAAIGGLSSTLSGAEGQAPGFALSTLEGDQISLTEFRGRPVLINFWATYCVPCRLEMPLIERMAKQHPRLVVLLVDERDSTPAARDFITEVHIRSTVMLDSDGKVGDLYRITGLPTTIFMRADGTIEGRYIGQTDEQIVTRHIDAIGA